MRPPAAVSAIERVEEEDLRWEVISDRRGCKAAGGKAVGEEEADVDIVAGWCCCWLEIGRWLLQK